MQFTPEDIHKYQDLCRTYFDEEIDEATAIQEMHNLIYLVALIYHPQAKDELARLRKTKAGNPDDDKTIAHAS
ncbi:hypothetical protein AB0A74_09560 [Saccharothrix sp. NPDC042600]|uniref:hypothetical protein n=1 Tax=Saccharothrix TaxID=2071 RepID=UPI0033FB94AC